MDDKSSSEEMASWSGDSPGERLPPPGVLELDAVYEALGDQRRRYLCYTLLEDTEWSLSELARKVAAWEHDCPEHAVTDEQHESMQVSLYHAHIPKLADERVLTFDPASETIRPDDHAEQVLSALRGMGATLDSNQESHARGAMDERED